jgi:hypothetical protein
LEAQGSVLAVPGMRLVKKEVEALTQRSILIKQVTKEQRLLSDPDLWEIRSPMGPFIRALDTSLVKTAHSMTIPMTYREIQVLTSRVISGCRCSFDFGFFMWKKDLEDLTVVHSLLRIFIVHSVMESFRRTVQTSFTSDHTFPLISANDHLIGYNRAKFVVLMDHLLGEPRHSLCWSNSQPNKTRPFLLEILILLGFLGMSE